MQKSDKVVQFPVDMDEMQRNVLYELLNARKECTEENVLTVRGIVAIIDALFYMVGEVDRPVSIPKGWYENKEKEEGNSWINAMCTITGNYCSHCVSGSCEHRRETN